MMLERQQSSLRFVACKAILPEAILDHPLQELRLVVLLALGLLLHPSGDSKPGSAPLLTPWDAEEHNPVGGLHAAEILEEEWTIVSATDFNGSIPWSFRKLEKIICICPNFRVRVYFKCINCFEMRLSWTLEF
jgi:hypothetical protein